MNLQNPEGIWDTEFPMWVQEHYVNVKGVNKGVDKCYFNTHWHLCWMIRISSSTKTSIQLSNWLDESTASRLLYRIRETPVIPLNLTSIHQGQQIWDTFMSELWPDGVLEAEWLRNHQSHLTTISLPRNENTNRRSLVAFLCPWMQPNWQPRNMWLQDGPQVQNQRYRQDSMRHHTMAGFHGCVGTIHCLAHQSESIFAWSHMTLPHSRSGRHLRLCTSERLWSCHDFWLTVTIESSQRPI